MCFFFFLQSPSRFIHYLSRSRGEPVRANTFESALQIYTRPVAAHVHVDLALVLVHALLPGRVQHVPGRTLAPERSVRVDALAAVARVRHELAFVQVLALVAAAHALGTQFGKRVCGEGTVNFDASTHAIAVKARGGGCTRRVRGIYLNR